MIGVVFSFMNEPVEVRYDNQLLFRTMKTYGSFVPISGLRLEKSGVVKEHPDLKDREDWREEAIKRLKIKIDQMKTEDEVIEYVIKELKSYGYIPLKIAKGGSRPISIK